MSHHFYVTFLSYKKLYSTYYYLRLFFEKFLKSVTHFFITDSTVTQIIECQENVLIDCQITNSHNSDVHNSEKGIAVEKTKETTKPKYFKHIKEGKSVAVLFLYTHMCVYFYYMYVYFYYIYSFC